MGDKYGKEIGEALGLGPNDEVWAQSASEIERGPHPHSGGGALHMDGHHITTDAQGNVSSQKYHSDDR
ncbi:hypothetical protein [Blastococcus atacamensis]|uniref:hypothetical protein n=1 Tax=Blastococcus atacamensis TaxID=2070508 RepID=UPI000CEC01D2|nr:hypothetical protein [Blastococcus atacamensis]